MPTKAELEVIKSNLSQAERARDSLSKTLSQIENAITRLDTYDRDDTEILRDTLYEIIRLIDIPNPLRVDMKEEFGDATTQYDAVVALFDEVRETMNTLEDIVAAMEEYQAGDDSYEPEDILADYENLQSNYNHIIEHAVDNY